MMQLIKECLVLLICGLTLVILGTTLFHLIPPLHDQLILASFVGGFFAMIGLTIGHSIINKYMR